MGASLNGHMGCLNRALNYKNLAGLFMGGTAYSFYLFSDLTYGMDPDVYYARLENSTVHYLNWLPTWDF